MRVLHPNERELLYSILAEGSCDLQPGKTGYYSRQEELIIATLVAYQRVRLEGCSCGMTHAAVTDAGKLALQLSDVMRQSIPV